MPFEKGRQKTGGRQKGGPTRKAVKFVDQLNNAGFNYVKELAMTLKEMKDVCHGITPAKDPVDALKKAAELKFFYSELKSLLPYMAPKLREKEVETIDEPEDKAPSAPISDEELLKVMGNGTASEEVQPRGSKIASPTVPKPTTGLEESLVGEEPEQD